MKPKKTTLCIYPRKGLFQVTKCNNCGHSFMCKNCDARVVVYRKGNFLSLLCHHCQTWYGYPDKCSQCGHQEIDSFAGGIDKFAEEAKAKGLEVVQLEALHQRDRKRELMSISSDKVYTTTRIYDPGIPYDQFEQVYIIRAESLLSSPDYLVSEEVHKQLMELSISLPETSRLVIDVDDREKQSFRDIESHTDKLGTWYSEFLGDESKHRHMFGFPPFENLVLFTTQEKKQQDSHDKIHEVHKQLQLYKKDSSVEIEIMYPHQARMLRRKGMYSHHCLLKFPKQYKDFSKLSKLCHDLESIYRVQVRLNPRHIF